MIKDGVGTEQRRAFATGAYAAAFAGSLLLGQAMAAETAAPSICEKTIKMLLKAPSTYVRISLDEEHVVEPFSEQTYIDRMIAVQRNALKYRGRVFAARRVKLDAQAELRARSEPAAGRTILLSQVQVEFDAKNLFGVPIRHYARCAWVNLASSPEEVSWSTLPVLETSLTMEGLP